MAQNETAANALIGKIIEDIGATFHAPLVIIGEKCGLFKAMDNQGEMTPHALAQRSGVTERYVMEWLPAMAAGGYVTYTPETGTYSLSEEQAVVLAREDSPTYMAGAFQAATAAIKSEPKIAEAFLTGSGVDWGEHDSEFYNGTDRFYRPQYTANLVSSWIPALDGVQQKLTCGAAVADVGCGYGTSTIVMAKAFPRSTFTGIDYHEPSVAAARQRAREAGLEGRVTFCVASAEDIPGAGYDLITTFDCLHDLGNPVAAAACTRRALKNDGTWMIVEPFAGDRVEDNLNPVGRLFYCASVLLCTPGSIAQGGELVLGGQAGAARLQRVVTEGGFSRFRRAAETPVNIVFEARP